MSAFDEVRARFAVLADYEGARDRAMLDLYDVRVTVDGPKTPDTAQVAEQLRDMIAETVSEPMPMVIGPRGNRRHRRAEVARQRGRT